MKHLAIAFAAGLIFSGIAAAQQGYSDRDNNSRGVDRGGSLGTHSPYATRPGDPNPYATRPGDANSYAPRPGDANPYATKAGDPNAGQLGRDRSRPARETSTKSAVENPDSPHLQYGTGSGAGSRRR